VGFLSRIGGVKWTQEGDLLRNGQLRELCGLDKVPPSWVYSRFLTKLLKRQSMIEEMEIFDRLVRDLTEALPGFGS
jgi:hypothetical protein